MFWIRNLLFVGSFLGVGVFAAPSRFDSAERIQTPGLGALLAHHRSLWDYKSGFWYRISATPENRQAWKEAPRNVEEALKSLKEDHQVDPKGPRHVLLHAYLYGMYDFEQIKRGYERRLAEVQTFEKVKAFTPEMLRKMERVSLDFDRLSALHLRMSNHMRALVSKVWKADTFSLDALELFLHFADRARALHLDAYTASTVAPPMDPLESVLFKKNYFKLLSIVFDSESLLAWNQVLRMAEHTLIAAQKNGTAVSGVLSAAWILEDFWTGFRNLDLDNDFLSRNWGPANCPSVMGRN